MKENQSTKAPHSLLPDTAVNNPELDQLDRAPFAASLSTAIRNLDGNDSFVIGLCGPWGSGKTSVLNFVLSDLEKENDDKLIILRFNPWWFSGREQLLEAFLAQFTATLNMPKRGEDAKKAGKLLGTLSAALRPVSLLPIIGEAAKAGKEAVDAIAGAANAYAEAVSKNVVAIRSEIDKLLVKSTHRIIVVMDDIDRLAATEIAQLFLILKAVADFPKTLYLLAFDHEVVNQAIREHLGVDGKTYLEKIVQLQIDVPPTAEAAIHQMFLAQLNEVLRDEVMTPKQVQYFWNVFHDGLKQFLVTPRAAKKLINMIRFAYPPLRGEVNPIDMMAIACLTTFVPKVISTIVTNPDYFTGTGARTSFNGQDEYQLRKAFHQAWINGLPDKERPAVEGLVKRLFPSVCHSLGGSGYSSGFETDWRRELRVCSAVHFEKYFRLAIPTGAISESEWKRIEECFKDAKELDEILSSYINQNCPRGFRSRASELLERALHFAAESATESAARLFESLFRVGDTLLTKKDEEKAGGLLTVDNRLRLIWVMRELLARFATQRQREDLFAKALSDNPGLHIASELLVSLGYQNGALGDKGESAGSHDVPIVGKRFVKQTAKNICDLIRKHAHANEGRKLVDHPDFMSIIINWWRLGDKKEVKTWVTSAATDDAVLVSLLMQQLSVSSSHRMNDRVAIETERIDIGFLANFLHLKELRQRCEKLLHSPPQWLSDRGQTALGITMNSIKPSGKPIDHWAKRPSSVSNKKPLKAKNSATPKSEIIES